MPVVFCASSFLSTKDETPFPKKKMSLQYGAKVELWLVESSASLQVLNHGGSPQQWHVEKWNILQDPKTNAQKLARHEQGGGIVLAEYLKESSSLNDTETPAISTRAQQTNDLFSQKLS